MTYIRIIIGIIIGEISLVLLTTLVQEVIFNGISYLNSSATTLLIGGMLTFMAAIGAGFLARISSGIESIIIPSFISLLIVLEMSYLIGNGLTTDPIWFDSMAGLSLVIGIWLGFNFFRFRKTNKLK